MRFKTAARFADGEADFSDYLILGDARNAGCDRFATFDRALLKEPQVFEP